MSRPEMRVFDYSLPIDGDCIIQLKVRAEIRRQKCTGRYVARVAVDIQDPDDIDYLLGAWSRVDEDINHHPSLKGTRVEFIGYEMAQHK